MKLDFSKIQKSSEFLKTQDFKKGGDGVKFLSSKKKKLNKKFKRGGEKIQNFNKFKYSKNLRISKKSKF